MNRLSASELLNLWERSYGQPPWQRAISFVLSGSPQFIDLDVMSFPIGFRDRHVARLRADHFGNRVLSSAECPQCRAPVEFEVHLDQCFKLTESRYQPVATDALTGSGFGLRPLTTEDIISQFVSTTAPENLVRRCLIDPSKATVALTAAEIDRLALSLEELDPESRIEFALSCPECQHSWSSLFDIVSVFWFELNTWARRVMQEVHVLASRYGWSEAEILQLTAWRRAVYLGLTGAR